MRLIRLFEILDDLRVARRPISAETLAQKYSVSVRTIYRDMSMLQGLGAPVRGEGGIGYQIEGGFFLPPLHFDENELDALVLGLRMVSSRSDKDLSDAASRAMGKISAVLPEQVRERFMDAPLLAHSNFPGEGQFEGNILTILRNAINRKERLNAHYVSLEGVATQRIIQPLGLTTFDEVWLLTAWCESKDGFRNFRVDKFKSVTGTDTLFHIRPGRSFQDYIKTL